MGKILAETGPSAIAFNQDLQGTGMILTETKGQANLPRYFSQCFGVAKDLDHGRLDIRLDDGRIFRAEGKNLGLSPRSRFTTGMSLPVWCARDTSGSAMPILRGGGARLICKPSWIS